MNNKVQCHLLEINLAGSCCFYCRILLGGILSCSPNSGKFLILSLHYSVIKTEITNSISSQSRNSLFRTTKIVQKEKDLFLADPKINWPLWSFFCYFHNLTHFFIFCFERQETYVNVNRTYLKINGENVRPIGHGW